MKEILSKCIHILNHHNVNFEDLTILCQLYLSTAEVQKEEGEAALIDPPKQGDEPREEGDMGSREQETPHREESCQAREQRAGLERSRQGDTVDSQLSQHR